MPFGRLPPKVQTAIFYGLKERGKRVEGIIDILNNYYGLDPLAANDLADIMVTKSCAACHGARLRPESLAVKVAGAGQIFVSEPNAFRRKMAKDLVPSAIVIDPMTQNVVQMIKDMTEEGVGVDVAIECVGLEASLNTCVNAVRNQGKVVQTGLHMKPASVDPMTWALKDISIEATWCYPVQCWPRIIRMVESGNFPIEKIVTANITSDHVVKQGFDALLDKSVNHMKILVTV